MSDDNSIREEHALHGRRFFGGHPCLCDICKRKEDDNMIQEIREKKGQIWGHATNGPPFKVNDWQPIKEAEADAARRTSESGCGFKYWVQDEVYG